MAHSNWRTPGVVLICGGIILTIAMGVVSALVNLPIDEREIVRPAATPA